MTGKRSDIHILSTHKCPPASTLSRRKLLQAGGLAVALGMTGGIARAGTGTFRVGAAHQGITIPLPTDGFAIQHDPLSVRVALFENGSTRTALVSVDLTSIGAPLAARWAELVAKKTGWPKENIRVSAGHSFSTPHVFIPGETHPGFDTKGNAALLMAVETALSAAAIRARQNLTAVRMGYGQGISHLAVNRDVQTPNGWWIGANDAGHSDPALSVMRFDDRSRRTVLTLINYSVQPSVLSGVTVDGKRVMSADLTGAVARRTETVLGGTTIFLPGAGGDQSPYLQGCQTVLSADGKISQENLGEKSYVLLDLLGRRLAESVLRVSRTIKPEVVTTLSLHRATVMLTGVARHRPHGPQKTWDYKTNGPVALPYSVLQIGRAVIVTTAPELSAILGQHIREASPFGQTMVVTMVGNAAKYLPDRPGYDRITYESISAPYAPGSGEAFVNAVTRKLKQLLPEK